MFENLLGFLKNKDVKFNEYERIGLLSSIKAGGYARVVIYPESTDTLCEVIRYLHNEKIKYRVLGRLSNVLVSDGIYNGAVIITDMMNRMYSDSRFVTAESGCRLSGLLWLAAKNCLSGGEELFMIPGSLGGAIYNNAGAHGRSISDIFHSARIYDPISDSIFELNDDEMVFSYRDSILKHRKLFLLSATLRFEGSDFESIKRKIQYFAKLRMASQPIGKPSLGCVFKKHKGVGAGYYIDMAGLKGAFVGGASVSEKHAGFIVNTGRASADDVISLAKYVKEKVKERFGVVLEEEIEII